MNVERAIRKYLDERGIKQTFVAEKCGYNPAWNFVVVDRIKKTVVQSPENPFAAMLGSKLDGVVEATMEIGDRILQSLKHDLGPSRKLCKPPKWCKMGAPLWRF